MIVVERSGAGGLAVVAGLLLRRPARRGVAALALEACAAIAARSAAATGLSAPSRPK